MNEFYCPSCRKRLPVSDVAAPAHLKVWCRHCKTVKDIAVSERYCCIVDKTKKITTEWIAFKEPIESERPTRPEKKEGINENTQIQSLFKMPQEKKL